MTTGTRTIGRDFCAAFGQAVAAFPDRTAVSSLHGSITYGELDTWSDQLAARLVDRIGQGPEPALIVGGHDEWTVAAFVALAKVGRPSVVLDITVPLERMRTIRDVAGPTALLAGPGLRELADEIAVGRHVVIDMPAYRSGEASVPLSLPRQNAGQGDPVLTIVFTSGSTGQPKGVIIGSTAFAEFERIHFVFGGDSERIGCIVPLAFMFGIMEIVRAVVTAAELHLFDPRTQLLGGFFEWAEEHSITVLGATPHLVRAIADAAKAQDRSLPLIRHIVLGGEAVLAGDIVRAREFAGTECVCYNALGSSEMYGLTALPIPADASLPHGSLPVGKPLPGRQVWLLDENGEKVLEPGRLGSIVGVAHHVAQGYWKDPEKTAERFSTLSDGRTAYKLGDMGRWDNDGNLVYVGRADHMVKVRGYLVEPAEVENHLRSGAEVIDCVVVGRPTTTGSMRLIAYVVPEPQKWLSGAATRRRLAAELPSYMVPGQFIEMTRLPRNPNGKVDRLALPEPPETNASLTQYGPARMVRHRLIADTCAHALGVESVGLYDDLFALGADSLTLEEIAAGLEPVLGRRVAAIEIVSNPTVSELAELPKRAAPMHDGVMVTLAAGGRSAPVFLIAGGGGLAVTLRDLAMGVGGDRPVYGLQAYGLEGDGRPDLSLGSIGRRFVRAIRSVQPEGPYNLVGHSFGAWVAVEVAKQLRAGGAEISYIGLLDPLEVRGRIEMRNRIRIDETRPAAGPARLKAGVRIYLERNHPLVAAAWHARKPIGRFDLYQELAGVMMRRWRGPGESLDVAATAFVVDGTKPAMSKGYFTQAPTLVRVGGDHLTMLRRPFVDGLAEALNGELERLS